MANKATCVVRARVMDHKGFICIKGKTVGISRPEFEYLIDPDQAMEMIQTLCDGRIVEKTRHVLVHEGVRWEVDEFHGDNAGLIVAEVELDREDQHIDLPDWVGTEVTHLERYFNMNLAVRPYRLWSESQKSGA